MEWSTQKLADKRKAKLEYLTHWHPWFAWFPVKVEDNHWVWLEYVERILYSYLHLRNLSLALWYFRRKQNGK